TLVRKFAPPPSPPAQSTRALCDNTNTLAVLNGPPVNRTPCTLSQEAHITLLYTYHWNNGAGSMPSWPRTILLRNKGSSNDYGPYAVTGSARDWTANVNIYVPAGSYEVIDSDPRTWSYNGASNNYGFVRVDGAYTSGAPLTPANRGSPFRIPSPSPTPTRPTPPAPPAGCGAPTPAAGPGGAGRLAIAPTRVPVGTPLCVASSPGFVMTPATVVYVKPTPAPGYLITGIALCGTPAGAAMVLGSSPPSGNRMPACAPMAGGMSLVIPIPSGPEGTLLLQVGYRGSGLPGFWNLYAYNPGTGATAVLPSQIRFVP
ncbi:MAG: hypothetical protein ACHP84_10045, partial [Caulobacterales bacterium]